MLGYGGQNYNKRVVNKVDESMTKYKYRGLTVRNENGCLYPR
jgi:hypothetical protein